MGGPEGKDPATLSWSLLGDRASVGECRMTAHLGRPHLSLVQVFKTLERRGRVSQCCAPHINCGPTPCEGGKGHQNKNMFAFPGPRALGMANTLKSK